MVAQHDGLPVIVSSIIVLYLVRLLVPTCSWVRPESQEEEEIRRELQKLRLQAWLRTIWITLFMNLALVALSLLLQAADGRPKYGWAALPCGATWCFCILYLLSRRGSRVTPQFEGAEDGGVGRRPSAYASLTALLTVLSLVHPSPLQGLLLGLQRLIFGVASLCPTEAAVFGLIASGARLASCHFVDGYEGVCGQDSVAAEVCFLLGTVLATYAVTEMCNVLIRVHIQQRRTADRAPEWQYSVDSSEGQFLEPTASNESWALHSILQATCDATVFLDDGLRVARPSPGLAVMLGFVGANSVVGVPFKELMAGDEMETTEFLKVLRRLEPTTPSKGVAAVAMMSMMHVGEGSVRVRCAYTRIAGEHGKAAAAAAYVLSLLEANPEDACQSGETHSTKPVDLGVLSGGLAQDGPSQQEPQVRRYSSARLKASVAGWPLALSDPSFRSHSQGRGQDQSFHGTFTSGINRQVSGPNHQMARTTTRPAFYSVSSNVSNNLTRQMSGTGRGSRARQDGMPISALTPRLPQRGFSRRTISIDAVFSLATDALRDERDPEPEQP